MKRRFLTTFALLLALLLTGNGDSSSIFAAPSTQTTTFNFTNAAQTFTVPAGVVSITVTATGGEGGTAFSSGQAGNAVGGLGGQVIGTISVTAGETLQINVGGAGGDAPTNSTGGTGGFNGGGDGGSSDTLGAGGAGGGASDIRRSPFALADRLTVAGGGGGGGGGDDADPAGGAGGGTTGVAGTDETGVTGGGGGTQAAGGTAGTGDVNGGVGTPGVGGAGGTVPIFLNETGGGGGGGGFFGGGGGGGRRNGGTFGAGGGGGSSLVPTGGSTTAGVNTGNGTVIFTYDGGCVTDANFTGTTTIGSDAAYSLNCFYGVAFVDGGEHRATGGNHYPDGVTVTYANGMLCFETPSGYIATGIHINQSDFRAGATCYVSTISARVDDGIAKIEQDVAAVEPAADGCTDTRVVVPEGAVPSGTEFILTLDTSVPGVAIAGYSVIRSTCDITTNTGQTAFDPPIYICIQHSPVDILAGGGDVSNLSVGYYDSSGDTWQPFVDANGGIGNADETCGQTDHLTKVGLMASIPTALPATGANVAPVVAIIFALIGVLFASVSVIWRRRQSTG